MAWPSTRAATPTSRTPWGIASSWSTRRETCTTLAGDGTFAYRDAETGGPKGTASFGYPSGLALDSQGFLLVSDDSTNRIRKVDLSDGTTTTFAGNGKAGFVDGSGGATGQAELNFNDYQSLGFSGMCGDGQDHFFIADVTNNAIRTL